MPSSRRRRRERETRRRWSGMLDVGAPLSYLSSFCPRRRSWLFEAGGEEMLGREVLLGAPLDVAIALAVALELALEGGEGAVEGEPAREGHVVYADEGTVGDAHADGAAHAQPAPGAVVVEERHARRDGRHVERGERGLEPGRGARGELRVLPNASDGDGHDPPPPATAGQATIGAVVAESTSHYPTA